MTNRMRLGFGLVIAAACVGGAVVAFCGCGGESVPPTAVPTAGNNAGHETSVVATQVSTAPVLPIGDGRRQSTIVRPEDRGESFVPLASSEVVRRLIHSTARGATRKAAKVLGDRSLAGKLKLSQDDRAKLDEYIGKQVALTSAATVGDRFESIQQIRRLWRLTAEKLIDSLGSEDISIVEASAKNLALMRNEDIIKTIIARLKASKDAQFKGGAILALGVMREKRECRVPDRETLGDDESAALATKLIMPVLTELQASETDPRTVKMLKMAFHFLKNPPDARPRPVKQ